MNRPEMDDEIMHISYQNSAMCAVLNHYSPPSLETHIKFTWILPSMATLSHPYSFLERANKKSFILEYML